MMKNNYRLVKERWYHKLLDKFKREIEIGGFKVHHYYAELIANDKGRIVDPSVRIDLEPSVRKDEADGPEPRHYFSDSLDVGQALTQHQKQKLGLRARKVEGASSFTEVKYLTPLGLEKLENEVFYFKDLYHGYRFYFDLEEHKKALESNEEEDGIPLEEINHLLHSISMATS